MFELANYIKLNTFTDLALMIFAGMAMGRLVKKVKLPNVTGYLVAGLILGPSILGVLSSDFLSAISVISDCALGFIAFSIGNEFKISFFKRVGVTPIIIAILESFFAVGVVTGVLIPVTGNLRFSLVLASIAAATAPAATIMVIKQYRAKGPVTETLLSVVALDDATALIMYSVATAVAGAIAGKSSSAAELVFAPAKEIFGAIIAGAVLGFIFLLPLKFFKKDSNRTALEVGFIFLGLGISQLFGFSSLLLCMALGAIVANFSSDVGKLMDISDRITPPVFMLFFVASGASLNIKVLPTVGIAGAVYIVFRVIGKIIGASLGAVIGKADRNIRKYLGPALMPQAGVAIGLSLAAGAAFPEYAEQIRAVILCATLIYELVGPGVAKTCLKKAGEIRE